MLNKIWTWMIIVAIIVSFFTGRVNETIETVFDSSMSAVNMCIKILGIMCFWSGLMEICKSSGMINIISKLIKPLTKILKMVKYLKMDYSGFVQDINYFLPVFAYHFMDTLCTANGGRIFGLVVLTSFFSDIWNIH